MIDTPTTFSIITTCKGRLAHLRQSLPLMVGQRGGCEVIVVDYDCPEGTASWVRSNHAQTRVVEVAEAPTFNPSKARNRGAALARGDWLVFVDADILLSPGFIERFVGRLSPGHFYRPRPAVPDMHGMFICSRSNFLEVGGYDEAIQGWGGEDPDIYHRLREFFARRCVWFPGDWLGFIEHSDDERVRFAALADKALSHRVNTLYRTVKYDLFKLSGVPHIALAMREQLHARVRHVVLDAVSTGIAQCSFNVDVSTLPGITLPRDCSLSRTLRYEFRAPTAEPTSTPPDQALPMPMPMSMPAPAPDVPVQRASVARAVGSPMDEFRFLRREPLSLGPTLFAMVRNETYLLPHFLAHYRQLGVENFVFYDDHSSDGSVELLMQQPSCSIITSDRSFRQEMPDGRSFTLYARRHVPESLGARRWVLTVDADEFLVLPPTLPTLRQLFAHLDERGHRCVLASMVDFYPQRLAHRNYGHALSPFDGSRHFDVDRTFARSLRTPRPASRFKGVRARLLAMLKERHPGLHGHLVDGRNYTPASLWKVPLIKTGCGVTLESVHEVNVQPPFDIELALAHFKFGPDLDGRIADALISRSYFRSSQEYEFLKVAIDVLATESLVYPGSMEYLGPQSLEAAGFVFVSDRSDVDMPAP